MCGVARAVIVRRMNSTKQLLSLTATILCASAVAPAAVLAESSVERGRYTGRTTQAAEGGAKPFAGTVTISLGHFSNPARVTRVELTARLRCADGTTRDVRYGKVIALGPQLERDGRFVHRDGGLEVRGRFGKKGRARGSFSYTVEACSVAGATWSASQR
jgi:hypothetical protein